MVEITYFHDIHGPQLGMDEVSTPESGAQTEKLLHLIFCSEVFLGLKNHLKAFLMKLRIKLIEITNIALSGVGTITIAQKIFFVYFR